MTDPFPPIEIPGVPDSGDCCIWQFHKFAEGDRPFDSRNHYLCHDVSTERGVVSGMTLLIQTPKPDCNTQTVVQDRSRLVTTPGPVIWHPNGLAIYSGQFTIEDPVVGKPTLFAGQIELYDQIGTHQFPVSPAGESCQEHIEGWLVGQGVRPDLMTYALHLAIAGRLANPNPAAPPPYQGSLQLILNGVLIQCRRQH